MALMWMEGFETFGTTTGSGSTADVSAAITRKYDDPDGATGANYCTQVQLADGRSGGYSLKGAFSYPTSSQYFHYVVPAADVPTNDTWIVGMAVKFASSFPDTKEILTLGRLTSAPTWITTYINSKVSFLRDFAIYWTVGRMFCLSINSNRPLPAVASCCPTPTYNVGYSAITCC